MKTKTILIAAEMFLAAAGSAFAAVRYVDLNSPSPAPPYTKWFSAATVIQDAVDAAAAGDEVVVTNGIYATGGRAVYGSMTNRVAVDKPLTLRSVNGPQFTVIQGYQVPGTTNGIGSIRCVYLAHGASLSGFTLTNGATQTSVNGVDDPSGGGVWCEGIDAVVSNCVAMGNSAVQGGGAYGGTLNGCTLSGNSASLGGGGASDSTLNNCTLSQNVATNSNGYECPGGGAFQCTLSNCTLIANSCQGPGGGASNCTLNNCTLTGNSANGPWELFDAYGSGGGAAYCTLNNCILAGNSASVEGGGTAGSTLNNCTVTGNSVKAYYGSGGGAYHSTLNNCIVYYNTSDRGANYDSSFLSYCCTTPLPPGTGNISNDPQLASVSHLSTASPCRGAGSAAYASGTDIDGEAWRSPPSIGCDEYHAGAATGPLTVNSAATFTNVADGFPVGFTAFIKGRITASTWDFGDGVMSTNQPYPSHAWTAPGDYAVVLRALNENLPGGISATVIVHVVTQPVHYVAAANPNPLAPYTSWAKAATNIQDALDAATVPGALVLVTNGTYANGGRAMYGTMTNRVAVDKPLTLQSVNGPLLTTIQGYQVPGATNDDGAIRCVYLTPGASVSGFTLTNGATRAAGYWPFEVSGGGAWCESALAVLSNCVVVGNSACEDGGGAFSGTLNNCTLIGNIAALSGGGAYASTLNNCTLTGNSAPIGGGVSSSGHLFRPTYVILNNCVVYFNTATDGTNYDASSALNFCCTTPQPTNGLGNITNLPLFVDLASGNLRLQSNSPCINAGNNACAPAGLDVDGNPRIVRGTVDIGAYEFQSPASVISYAWLQYYGLPTDGSADYADPDGDGMNDWQEWRAGTDPTNPLSVLRMLAPTGVTNMSGINVTWQNVSGISYFIERSTNLGNQPAFSLLQSNIVGQAGTTTWTDTNASGPGPFFYRVDVRN